MRDRLLSSTAERALLGGASATLLTVMLAERNTEACTPAKPIPLEIDAAAVGVDVTPPGQPLILDVVVVRGEEGGECGHMGDLYFYIESGGDDRTTNDEIGYFFESEYFDGVHLWLPQNVQDQMPWVARDAGDGRPVVYFAFDDLDLDSAIEFDVRVANVDRAGNMGPFSPVVHVVAPPTGCGCTVAERRRPAAAAALLLAIGAWALRRSANRFCGRRRSPRWWQAG